MQVSEADKAAVETQKINTAPENKAGNIQIQERRKGQKSDVSRMFNDKVVSIITWLCRLVVGGTFIFSGTVKAIDPWGTIFKLQDYIAVLPDGLFGWMLPLITVVAFALFSFEFLLGVVILTGCYRRVGAVATALLMLVMLPLTLWIALKDPVADCGCFGDAFILTNWQTFWKNVVLTAMCVWLVIFNKRARCLVIPTLQWLVFLGSLAYTITVGFIGYNVQPMLDFRPYPVGGPLTESTAEAEETQEDMQSVWKRGDETVTISADSIPEGDDWEFVERLEGVSGKEADKTPVKSKGLAIFDGEDDITEDIISPSGEQIIVLMTNLPEVSSGNFYKLNSLYTYCTKQNIPMFAVSDADVAEREKFIEHSMAEYPIYQAEDTAIKEVVRGNPAAVYLKDGKIVWKSSFSGIPVYDFVESTPNHEGALARYAPFAGKATLETMSMIFVAFILLVMLLSHVPMVIRYTSRKLRRNKWVKDGDVVKINSKVVKMLLPVCMMASLLTGCSDNGPDNPAGSMHKERTILVYMVATNSLSSDAPQDMSEMLTAYSNTSDINTNLLVYCTQPSEQTPTLSRIVKDKRGVAVFQTLKTYDGQASSLTKSRIVEVMADMKRMAPAEDYGLFLWSHASNWLSPSVDANKAPGIQRAFGDDYGKSISVHDLAEAIPHDTFSFIWMDCCLMGSVEVAYELRNHCRYYVAYPTRVLAAGAPYDEVLPHLITKNFSLQDAAGSMFSYYADNSISTLRSCTVSITDMSKMDALAERAHIIAKSHNPDIDISGLQIYGSVSGVRSYDFRQVFARMAGVDTDEVKQLDKELGRAVIYKRATPEFLGIQISADTFSGLSCFALSAIIDSKEDAYYKTLGWYKAVYE